MSFKDEYPERYEKTKEVVHDWLKENKGVEFRTAQLTDLDGFVAGNMQVREVLENLAIETPIHEVDDATWKYSKESLDEFYEDE